MLYIPVLLLAVVLVVWFKQYQHSFYKKPSNYPTLQAAQQSTKPIFIAFGDSHTQANLGASWYDILEKNHPEFTFFNAGNNADLTETLLKRIDEVIECNPQIISILVGTNDVNATIGPARMQRYYQLGKITEDATEQNFINNYRSILERLKNETSAKIILISLPPITEDFGFEANLKADAYSAIIKALAEEFACYYVPFREKLKSTMPYQSSQLTDFDQGLWLINKAGIKKYFLGKSWNQIAAERKAMYLTDNIHFNDDAAAILAGLLTECLESIKKDERL